MLKLGSEGRWRPKDGGPAVKLSVKFWRRGRSGSAMVNKHPPTQEPITGRRQVVKRFFITSSELGHHKVELFHPVGLDRLRAAARAGEEGTRLFQVFLRLEQGEAAGTDGLHQSSDGQQQHPRGAGVPADGRDSLFRQ
jgi:hypothetical protein